MTCFTLRQGLLQLDVSSQGGTIEGFWGQDTPLMRPGKKNGIATDSSCFPLVPFGNRVSGNYFTWQGQQLSFEPNVAWDEHYLHGDGWLGEWACVSESADSLQLTYLHSAGVYQYQAWQTFHLTGDRLTATLSVTNQGQNTLPFGLGWHPFFPLTPQTTVRAKASGYWLEREQWLAGDYCDQLPESLNFNHPLTLPQHWVNNGFAGWDGVATITQPQAGYQLTLVTDPPAPCYFMFVSDPLFDDGYTFDFFCFEPMSHAPDDHHRPYGGSLVTLAPGRATSLKMTLNVAFLTESS